MQYLHLPSSQRTVVEHDRVLRPLAVAKYRITLLPLVRIRIHNFAQDRGADWFASKYWRNVEPPLFYQMMSTLETQRLTGSTLPSVHNL